MIEIPIIWIIMSNILWIVLIISIIIYIRINSTIIDNQCFNSYANSISKNYVDFELDIIRHLLDDQTIEWEKDQVTYEVSSLLYYNIEFISRLNKLLSEKKFKSEVNYVGKQIINIKFYKVG